MQEIKRLLMPVPRNEPLARATAEAERIPVASTTKPQRAEKEKGRRSIAGRRRQRSTRARSWGGDRGHPNNTTRPGARPDRPRATGKEPHRA